MLDGIFRRRRLPHWDVEDGTYFVTACLEGSIPSQGLVDLNNYREEIDKRKRPDSMSEDVWEHRKHKLIFARVDRWLDRSSGARYLEDPRLAKVVRDAVHYFAGIRYDPIAFVVMPSHFHWVFRPRTEWVASHRVEQEDLPQRSPRERIMQSIKGYTARICNQLLKRSGAFWQDESFDHVVRNPEELARIVRYIEENPVRAGLSLRPQDWLWSSAAECSAI